MIAMIFEFWMNPEDTETADEYSATSNELRDILRSFDGFNGVERFESCGEPGKFVAIGFFDNEDAVTRWRTTAAHRRAQALGRSRYFTNYRLRMAELARDYGPTERDQAPTDSNHHHQANKGT